MTKKHGFKIRIDAFLELDKKNFGKQAETYGLIAEMQKTGKLPANFFDTAVIVKVDARQGGQDFEDAPGDDGDVPLTTEPLAEGSTVIASAMMLDGNVFQTVKLADGTEQPRRVSADQDEAERKRDKKIPKPTALATE